MNPRPPRFPLTNNAPAARQRSGADGRTRSVDTRIREADRIEAREHAAGLLDEARRLIVKAKRHSNYSGDTAVTLKLEESLTLIDDGRTVLVERGGV